MNTFKEHRMFSYEYLRHLRIWVCEMMGELAPFRRQVLLGCGFWVLQVWGCYLPGHPALRWTTVVLCSPMFTDPGLTWHRAIGDFDGLWWWSEMIFCESCSHWPQALSGQGNVRWHLRLGHAGGIWTDVENEWRISFSTLARSHGHIHRRDRMWAWILAGKNQRNHSGRSTKWWRAVTKVSTKCKQIHVHQPAWSEDTHTEVGWWGLVVRSWLVHNIMPKTRSCQVWCVCISWWNGWGRSACIMGGVAHPRPTR